MVVGTPFCSSSLFVWTCSLACFLPYLFVCYASIVCINHRALAIPMLGQKFSRKFKLFLLGCHYRSSNNNWRYEAKAKSSYNYAFKYMSKVTSSKTFTHFIPQNTWNTQVSNCRHQLLKLNAWYFLNHNYRIREKERGKSTYTIINLATTFKCISCFTYGIIYNIINTHGYALRSFFMNIGVEYPRYW